MSYAALQTPLTRRLAIDLPIIQAPIGRVSGPELAAAVSNAGGLGMLGVTFLAPDDLRASIRSTRALTQRPFGVNMLLHWDQRERLAISLEESVRIVSYHWSGVPLERVYIDEPHSVDAVVMHTVGSADEARRAVETGVDVIVAQGYDAGGHVWGSVGTLALIPAVVDAVGSAPVIAAGGIGDGRGLAAALALGAQGGWMGTRFAATDEALCHPEYRARIVAATETDAVWSTGVFDRGFPAAVRTLDNSTLRSWRDAGAPAPGGRPSEEEIVAHRPDGDPIMRYDTVPPIEGMTGEIEAMALYAGQSAGVIREILPAGEVVRRTADEAVRVLETIGANRSPVE